MGDLLKAVSGGLARFVMAWLMPSLITVALMALFLLPLADTVEPFATLARIGAQGSLETIALIIALSVTLSVLFAYTSLPIYRVLEGYHLPRGVKRRMTARHVRRLRIQRALQDYQDRTGRVPPGLDTELLALYPDDPAAVLPTRLGNALRSMERFGHSRYGLDSQRLWYELQAVAPLAARRDTEEARSAVDFFVSSIAHALLLAAASVTVAIATRNVGSLVLAVSALLFLPVGYIGAVRNMKDWSMSVKALVNLSRGSLAVQLGMMPPQSLDEEQHMWESFIGRIEYNDRRFEDGYDAYRSWRLSSASSPSATVDASET